MRCALASIGFINNNLQYNKQAILNTMIKYAGDADIVLFGEAFLQGFYAATFEPEHDKTLAITQDDCIIREICDTAKQYAIAVSFGFIEKDGDIFYSSQITIDQNGTVIDVFRRVSPGWKLPHADDTIYREGEGFHLFTFMDKKITVGLCGDLWYDENSKSVKQLHPDIVFWPVYTDFNYNEWNSSMKLEYAEQVSSISGKVLCVNSVCLDKEAEEIARGGAALFVDGQIESEIPAGQETVLIIET